MVSSPIDQERWIEWMLRKVKPVLEALTERKLKQRMPIHKKQAHRDEYTYLEARGRLLAGMAP